MEKDVTELEECKKTKCDDLHPLKDGETDNSGER